MSWKIMAFSAYKSFTIVFILVVCLFVTISKIIFDEVYKESRIVIDEAFHIPQGLEYCRLNFKFWDPKITTLPGLYIISAVILSPFNACSDYWLKFISFTATFVNYILLFAILQVNNRHDKWKNLFLATNLSLLPPLLFFGNLYYTDTVSITFILLMILLFKIEYIILASVIALFSVIMRQTNIIWVAMLFAHLCLVELYTAVTKKKQVDLSFSDIKLLMQQLQQRKLDVKKVPKSIWCNILSFLAVCLSFVVFIITNKGIVVGDKSAHVMTFHFVQILYFLLFCLIFTWPYFISSVLPFLYLVQQRKVFSLLIISFMGVVVLLNTEVHPYLLADNRHYTFYIWNRFYQNDVFRYLIIPAYYFGGYCFFRCRMLENNLKAVYNY
ncbi:putative Dol-P-Glc:Glc(2)Man(9)GlcNAc(2)-PP-Dol alpha-1,2-glucosyltransferase [Agrilus planipennis]|uniref:Dol-P-Glc:Glc(2)Man(9)GlcNAc(2)-PP-Dol alpha-1,2-glucosyltransferase n=1 Tax=Agrilus planipennis TaxID=224129 RepID=A0A7F5RE45_AGRPL|nr:putative Dol-P-Glc:Glc(2)Man(9)GlcNAc(2)-PP-Dol alpha-1,2-glucosyltransferase [Agrilus planipennis]